MNPDHEMEILLVEDNPRDAELALISLKQHHLANKVIHVKDGAEALDYLFCTGAYSSRDASQHPKVVLLDLKLPKVDGLEVLRAIKTNPKTKLIPVVILTTSSEDKDKITSYDLGANSYVRKPVDFDELYRRRGNWACIGCF